MEPATAVVENASSSFPDLIVKRKPITRLALVATPVGHEAMRYTLFSCVRAALWSEQYIIRQVRRLHHELKQIHTAAPMDMILVLCNDRNCVHWQNLAPLPDELN